MRLFTSSQGDNLRQKGGIKSFDMWEAEHWRWWRWGDINRVKRRTHLGDRLVRQEAQIFEGLQGFWVTQPARKLLLAAKVTMVSKLLFSNIWEKYCPDPKQALYLVGAFSHFVLFTATIRFSLLHCCHTFNCPISPLNHCGQKTQWCQSLPNHDKTRKSFADQET